ncbi:hypothetical protein [Mucilaginibacter agri]|uniref:NHL repeat-containing protein n=1 Tax=Mucilaginibacter agri TaxID=2695265 RepID=A0A965ZJJ7_9SPHI|nr:hypothetical protein [Mucilaginibacter agri]NCD71129.1 hypothetical protein [Mucilaginibacter agri]
MKTYFTPRLTILFFVFAPLLWTCKSDMPQVKNSDANTAPEPDRTKSTNDLFTLPKVIAGKDRYYGSTDGIGAKALFNQPSGIFVDVDGSILVADMGNNKIRRIVKDSIVSTLTFPNVTDGGPGTIVGPVNVAANGNLGFIAIVCPGDIFYYKPHPIDQTHPTWTMSHTGAAGFKPYWAITWDKAYGEFFWLSISASITTNDLGFANPSAYGVGGKSAFNITDPIKAVSVMPTEKATVYAATRTKFYTIVGYNDDYGNGTSSAAFPGITLTSITSIACSKDGKRIYVADNGDIKAINLGYRGSISTILTGVYADGIALSLDGAYLYYSSQTRNTISKYKL